MRDPILRKIEREIEKVVKEYKKSPSEELYQEWLSMMGQYNKQHEKLKNASAM